MKRNFSQTLNLLCLRDSSFLKKNGTLNITAAARVLKINQPTLLRMLDGDSSQPREDNLQKLRSYFKVTTDQLMGLSPIAGIDDFEKDTDAMAQIEKLIPQLAPQELIDLASKSLSLANNKQ